MNTSSFLTLLRQNTDLPLVFRAQGDIVSPGYHLTEVKRVTYETMDCGAMTHNWAESQFEIWVPPLADVTPGRGHMPASKFLRIIDRVEAKLPLNGEAEARIHASFEGQPAALHEIKSVEVRDAQLWIELTPDRARCKAAERRVASLTGACCGVGSNEKSDGKADDKGCGCGSPAGSPAGATAPAAACCA